MADVNANIGVHIDTSAALAELKNLQRQLANFHSSVSKSSAAAAMAQKGLQTNLLNSINATGKFRAQMGLVRTSTESFTHALETNKLSMREYFRFAGGSTRTFGKLFKQEFNTIGKVAEERVKKMQTQYIKMGRDASGAMKAISITPNTLNMKDYSTKLAVAAQKQALFNQLLKQGSTNLLNFGKNTQWAGRQLMVGFTIPLAYFGTAAAKTFMDLEKQAIRFKRVYGDMFTTTDQTNKALADIQQLAEEFTKYGVAVVDTMEMAANAAAMGKTGADLTAQVAQATRLAVLGGVEQAQALETTISVTNAFGIAAEDLAGKINFLNAVENQTVVSIEDLTIAIPKAGPVVKQLGGDVEDLAFFLTAMKEGGINASEGANALKSGLASLINPTEKASKMLAGFGINIKAIVEGNQGDIKETVIDFAQALDTLDPLNRARAIEQLFGKFQFSRLSTLFQNVTKDGTQAARVLKLTGASIEELAILSERELGVLEDAVGTNFKESVEKLKLAIAPIGKTFLEAVTPIVQVVGRLLDKFNNLGDGTKKFIVIATTLVGVIGPVLLMTFGLLLNAGANIIKLFATMRSGFLKAGTNSGLLAQQTQYLNSEQLEAATVAASLNQAHTRLTQSFTAETTAIRLLRQAYIDATIAATNFARANPGMMMPGFKPGMKGGKPKGFASGTTGLPGPKGAGDIIPVLGAPGEAIIPAKTAQDDRFKPLIAALVSGDIKGYKKGSVGLGDDFSHVGGLKNLNIDELLKNPKITALEKQKLQVYKQILISQGKPTTIGSYGSLAYSFDSQMNKALAKGGVSIDSFEKAWINRGPEKWMSSNIPPSQAKIVDDAILKQIKASGATKVTDAMIEQTFKNLPAEIKSTSAYSKMNSLHSELGSYGIGRGLGSNPKTSEAILADAKKKGYIKDYKIETRTSDSGVIKTKSLIVTNNDGTQVNLGRGSKTNRQYLPDTQDTRRKSGIINGQTSKAKSPALSVVGGGASDNRQVAVGKNETILNSKTTSALRSGKRVSVPGIGRFGLLGADQGIPKGQSVTSPGMAVSEIEKQFRAEQKSLRRQIEKVEQRRLAALKQETKIIQEKIAVTEKQIPLTKQQLKEQKREVRAQRAGAVGRVAGPVAGIAGIGAMAGFATGNTGVGTAMMGVSALATIAPMLTNPLGIAVAAAATLAGGFFLLNKRMADARKKQIEYIDSVTAGTKKMQKVGELTGKVGASQIAQKQRETGARTNEFRTGYDREDNQFGTNFLSSEIGKEIFKGFNDSVAKDGPKAAELLATQLAAYISDGVMSAEQANSVARAIGINLGDMSISTNISGELRELIGPDGQNLLTDPLKVRLNIITAQEQSTEDLSEKIENINGQTSGSENRAFAAATAVSIGKNLQIIQAQRDAQFQTNQSIIDGLEKQKATTTDKAKQLQLEDQIIDAKARQKTEDAIIAEKIKENLKNTTKIFEGLNSASFKETYIKTLRDSININQKDNPFLKLFLEAGSALKDESLEVQINTAVEGGLLNISTALKLMEMFAGTEDGETKLKTVIETTLTSQDPGVFQKLMEIISDKNINPEIKLAILTDQENFEDVAKVLDRLKDFDGDALNLEVLINTIGLPGLTKLAKQFKAVEKIKGPITVKTLAEISTITDDPTLNMSGLVDIWSKYENASDVIKKTVIQEYISVFKSIGNEEAEDLIKNELAASGGSPDRMDERKRVLEAKYYTYEGVGKDRRRVPNLPAIAAALVSQSAVAALNTIPDGDGDDGDGGGTRDTTLDDLLRQLKLTRDASIDAQGGLEELKRVFNEAGGDVTKFSGVIEQLNAIGADTGFIDFISGLDNATQATYLNVDLLEKGIVQLTDAGKKAMALYKEAALGAFYASSDSEIADLNAQVDGFNRLTKAGVGVADSLKLIANAEQMRALAQAKTPEELDTLIKKYKDLTAAQLNYLITTDPARAFKDRMEETLKYYDFLEREARASVKLEIDRINDLIDANERLIETQERFIEENINRPIDKYNQDLAVIDRAIEKINEKYNEQEKALQTIFDLQNDIAQEEKGRITIADALTRGDISAAAQAVQEERQAAAQRAQEESSKLLQIAREKEIAKVTNSNGLTRTQIEEKIYALEQQRIPLVAKIVELQDKNYTLQTVTLRAQEDSLKATLSGIDAARFAYEQQVIAIEAAQYKANGFNGILLVAEATLTRMKAIWDAMNSKSEIQVATAGISTTDRNTGSFAGKAVTQIVPGRKLLPLAMGGQVPKYMVSGGYSKGTDTIPAMLTPGEFIVRKNAVDSFGVNNLNKINDGSYGGSSVYNYSLSVNVKSDSSPDDIARTVMTQIKRIDSQRIKTQRGA